MSGYKQGLMRRLISFIIFSRRKILKNYSTLSYRSLVKCLVFFYFVHLILVTLQLPTASLQKLIKLEI